MKNFLRISILFLIGFSIKNLKAQTNFQSKEAINNNSFKEFAGGVSAVNISGSGKYLTYINSGTLVIRNNSGTFHREFSQGFEPTFTEDDRHIVFRSSKGGNGLYVYNLDNNHENYIPSVEAYYIPKNGIGRWLLYKTTSHLIAMDLYNYVTKEYAPAQNVVLSNDGTRLYLIKDNEIVYLNLTDKIETTIYNGLRPQNISVDGSGKHAAFITTDSTWKEMWYYQDDQAKATKVITKGSGQIKDGFEISSDVPLRWNSDGSIVSFNIIEKSKTRNVDVDLITKKLDVWNFQDEYLQERQLLQAKVVKNYSAIISIAKKAVVNLEDDTLELLPLKDGFNNYALTLKRYNVDERYWKSNNSIPLYLVRLKDGKKEKVINNLPVFTYFQAISPCEKFVIWFNPKLQGYYSYEIATGKTRNISHEIKQPLTNSRKFYGAVSESAVLGIPRWIKGDSSILIYDHYDIWRVDLLNRKKPVNITNGYGRKHLISFRVATDQFKNPVIDPRDTLLLTALDVGNKNNGFWKTILDDVTPPKPVVKMDSVAYYFPYIFESGDPPSPIKAKNAYSYLLWRQRADEFPNLFLLDRLSTVRRITSLAPQKNFNWMTSELISWKMSHGILNQGILYKPEDFDPTKKYPVIITYYDKQSSDLHRYRIPIPESGRINIPWYVSNGYLVFIVDIERKTGCTSEGIVKSVVSGVKKLSNFQFVDMNKLGLQGHSFGGFETNVLIANTGLFRAAQESAGISNAISFFGYFGFGGKHLAAQYEVGQSNLRTTPWDNPKIYLRNSPVLFANKIKTPLLIVHNKGDEVVHFSQAVEMFTALRRLKKPVWILQYDGSGHSVDGEDCVLDYNIRQQQFFDYYLKDKPAPVWMTQGISARDKGVKSGLQLDSLGSRP